MKIAPYRSYFHLFWYNINRAEDRSENGSLVMIERGMCELYKFLYELYNTGTCA
jgi:hypothetical protein